MSLTQSSHIRYNGGDMKKIGIAALLVFLLAIALIFGFTFKSHYDSEIRIIKIGQINNGPWRVIFEQNGNQYMRLFDTKYDADIWIDK